MRIVIVGAGAVGSYLAERLAFEGQDVVVIEADPQRAQELQESVDCLVITANGASIQALEDARVGDAELMIAVTSSDAVNPPASVTVRVNVIEAVFFGKMKVGLTPLNESPPPVQLKVNGRP